VALRGPKVGHPNLHSAQKRKTHLSSHAVADHQDGSQHGVGLVALVGPEPMGSGRNSESGHAANEEG